MRNADIVGDNIQKKFEEGDYLSFFVDEFIKYLQEQKEEGEDVDTILEQLRLDTDQYLPFNNHSFRRLCWIFANSLAYLLKDEDLSDIDNYEDMEFYTKIVQGHWHLMSQEEE